MPDHTEQPNRQSSPSPSPSPSSQEEVPANHSTARTRTSQSTQTRPEISEDHTTTTNDTGEEEEEWYLIPITFQPPQTSRLPTTPRFPNLSTVITQIGSQILIEEEIAIPREDSPTLGTQDSFRTLIESIETETEEPAAIPPRSPRRIRRRSPSSESEVTEGRRENRVEYIGSQGLDRVNRLNQVPSPPPQLVSRLRRRDATIGSTGESVTRIPMPPSGRFSRLRGRNVSDGIGENDAYTEYTRWQSAMRMAMEAGIEGEGGGFNGVTRTMPNSHTSSRPRVSFSRHVGNSLMLDVGEDEDNDNDEDDDDDEVLLDESETEDDENFDGFEDSRDISDSNPVEETEEQNPQEEEDYNFTPQRRHHLMQQMRRDINQYTTRREEEFGQEHGYQLYPSHTEPSKHPAIRNRIPNTDSNSPEPQQETTSSPRLRRSAFPGHNLREIITSQDPLTLNSSPPSNPSGSHPVPIRNRGRAPRLTPLAASTPDHAQDFAHYLYTTWRNSHPEMNNVPISELLAYRNLSFFAAPLPQPPSVRDLLIYEQLTDSLESDILWLIINRAVTYDLDQREATEFLRHWNQYISNFQNPYPQVPGMIPLLHMQFVIALRLGWGSWVPSYAFHRSTRRLFVRESTVFRHVPWDGISTGPGDPRRSAMHWITAMRGIPFRERIRMLDLAGEGEIDINRVVGIFQTWMLNGGWVENSRLREERRLSAAELRMDRLERIIREEGFLNLRGIGALSYSLDVADSSEDED